MRDAGNSGDLRIISRWMKSSQGDVALRHREGRVASQEVVKTVKTFWEKIMCHPAAQKVMTEDQYRLLTENCTGLHYSPRSFDC